MSTPRITVAWAVEKVDHNEKLIRQKDGEVTNCRWGINSPPGTPKYTPMLITRGDLLERLMATEREVKHLQKAIADMEALLNGPTYVETV